MPSITVRYIGRQIPGHPAEEQYVLPASATLRDLIGKMRARHGEALIGQGIPFGGGLLDHAVLIVDGVARHDLQTRLSDKARVTVLVLTQMMGG